VSSVEILSSNKCHQLFLLSFLAQTMLIVKPSFSVKFVDGLYYWNFEFFQAGLPFQADIQSVRQFTHWNAFYWLGSLV